MNYRNLIEYPVKLITGKRTVGQALNLLKYKASSPAEVLKYSPIVLCVSPTDRCNLSCDMCLTHSPKAKFNPYRHKPVPDMSYELFKQIVDRFPTALSIQLIGTGEPLLNKDYFRMVEYAAVKGRMDVTTTSNGTILEGEIDEIVSSPLASFFISLNGHNAEEFDRLTGCGTKCYQKIYENIAALIAKKRLVGASLSIGVSFVIDKTNFRFLDEMIRVADKLGADEVKIVPYFSSLDIAGYTSLDRSLFEDDKQIVEALHKITSPPSGMKIALPPLLKMSPTRSCRVFFAHIRVDGAGNIGGCSRMLLDIAGNGKFTDKDVWNNDYFRKMRRIHLDSQLPLPEPCKVCPENMG